MKPDTRRRAAIGRAGPPLLCAALLTGCHTEHEIKIAPIEVKPIYATLDVNLRVKIERELEDVFAYEKDMRSASAPAGAAPGDKP